MKYAYYRDRENNITNHHEIPEEWTEEEVEEKVKQFIRPNYERDVLQEMIDHLEDVIDFLEGKGK